MHVVALTTRMISELTFYCCWYDTYSLCFAFSISRKPSIFAIKFKILRGELSKWQNPIGQQLCLVELMSLTTYFFQYFESLFLNSLLLDCWRLFGFHSFSTACQLSTN